MTFIYNGKKSSDFNCDVFRIKSDSATKRAIETIDIPGRSGAMIVDQRRYENVSVEYYCTFHGENADSDCNAMMNFLLSQTGYQKLVDSEHPGEFYKAFVENDIDPTLTSDRGLYKFELVFSRKPQRYLSSGETTSVLTTSGTIKNPTRFNSQPLLKVYGTGALGIGSQTITITAADEYTYIDCEMMDAYKGATNKNEYIQLSGHNFPVLSPGVNNIVLGSGITRVEITPRWWRL